MFEMEIHAAWDAELYTWTAVLGHSDPPRLCVSMKLTLVTELLAMFVSAALPSLFGLIH